MCISSIMLGAYKVNGGGGGGGGGASGRLLCIYLGFS